MTQMAEAVIYPMTTNLTLQDGWLQNEQAEDPGYNEDSPIANVNAVAPEQRHSVRPGGPLQRWQPAEHAQPKFPGIERYLELQQSLGDVNAPNGIRDGPYPGTTIIYYTSSGGMAFSEWIMSVGSGIE
jgi:hypothetical protein